MTSNIKQIKLYIPENENLPVSFQEFTPQETWIILNTGAEIFQNAKLSIHSISSNSMYSEIYEQINEKKRKEIEDLTKKIEELEVNSIVYKEIHKKYLEDNDEKMEKEISKRLELNTRTIELIKNTFENETRSLKELLYKNETENIKLNQELDTNNRERASKIRYEIDEKMSLEKEKYEILLNERERQNQIARDTFEKAISKMDVLAGRKSTVELGQMGECTFRDLTDTFRDFEEYKLMDVHVIAGQGDFHMKFKEFDILADAKFYNGNVNSTAREKLKRDLKDKEHIHFGWLVSMNTKIDRFDRAPMMFEWIENNKCICYINSLLLQENPREVLRSLWFACKELNRIIVNDEIEISELSKMKEYKIKVVNTVQKMKKNIREMNGSVTLIKQTIENMDEQIRELLNDETENLIDTKQYSDIVVNWWNIHLEKGEGTLKSTDIWYKFRGDNKELLSEHKELDTIWFKNVLCGFLSEKQLIKPKIKNGAYDVKNIAWKNIPVLKIQTK